MTGAATEPWEIIAYEVRMFKATYEIMLNPTAFAQLQKKVLENAVEESAILHTRILCEVFLDRGFELDDIHLSKLFLNWKIDGKYRRIRQIQRDLRRQYGSGTREGTPCWIFNKMMAHPTTRRGISYDYIPVLRNLAPYLLAIIKEIEALRGMQFTWSW
jgi:hypothetical protein